MRTSVTEIGLSFTPFFLASETQLIAENPGTYRRGRITPKPLKWRSPQAFRSLSAKGRRPMLYCVTPHGKPSLLDLQLLEFAVQVEDDEGNLRHLLSMIPKSDLPLDMMYRLVLTVALRQTRYTAGIAILVAAREDEGLAEYVASMDTAWLGAMSALSEYRDLIQSGSESRDAIFEVLLLHRSEWS